MNTEEIIEVRYSNEDLVEFGINIEKKLETATTELEYLKGVIESDDPEQKFEKKQLQQMIDRQQTFIDNLNAALKRVDDKTYGICRVTGKLIEKDRLLKVPHATLSLEAKLDKQSQEALAASEKVSEGNKAKKSKRKKQPDSIRYSDDDLRNFKTLISNKIEEAEHELKYLQSVLHDRNLNIKVEDYEDMSPAEVQALIDRKKSYISELNSALDRIKSKTYGVDESTGELIPKEILLRTPIIKRLTPTPETPSAVIEQEKPKRTCRICGCTDDDCRQCIEKTGDSCHWIDADLCSACEEEAMKESEQPELIIGNKGAFIALNENELKHLEELNNNLSNNNNDEMNFFQQLAGLGHVDINLRMMQDKNGKITMEVAPGAKSTAIKPILITGTPAELDEGFFRECAPGIKSVLGIISNIDEVKKDAEKKTTAPAATAASKPGVKKPVKKSAPKKSQKKVPGKVVGELLKPEEQPAAEEKKLEESATESTSSTEA